MSEKKYQNENWLREKYHKEGLTLSEIGDICGVTDVCINDNMKKMDIPRRDFSDAQTKRYDKRLYEESWLRENYIENQKSMYEIAEELNVKASTVLRHLRNNNIETRRPGQPKPENIDKLENESWMEKEYMEKEKSLQKIADMLGVCADTVKKHLERHGFETREEGFPEHFLESIRNPKDIKYPYHSFSWRKKRKEIKDRDDFCCVLCGSMENLCVHHISPVEKYKNKSGTYDMEEANDSKNLVTLCNTCHGKITVRKLFYEKNYELEEFVDACQNCEVKFNGQ